MLGPLHDAARVQVWSTGQTLEVWAADLRALGVANVDAVAWKPGAPMPEEWRARTKRKAGDTFGASVAVGARVGLVRLFAFGKEKARQKVRASVRDWDPAQDWFVA